MRSPIPPQAIAGARRQLEALLVATCTITSYATTTSASGATKRGTATTTADVPCRVELRDQEPDGRVDQSDNERFGDASWVVFLPHTTVVDEGDTIDVDDAPDPVLVVVGVSDRQTDSFLLQAFCKERT